MMCRDGHESIVLAIDSSANENTIHYDVNVESDMMCNKWNEWNLCWVKTLWTARNKLDNMNVMLASMLKRLEEKVTPPLSAWSNTPEWFMLRIFSFASHASDRIINTMLKLSKDHLHALGVENFSVSEHKTCLGITSSGDQLQCAELTEIKGIVNLLN